MHDLGGRLKGESWSVTTAVLCGFEALSAQRWAVGAISLCARVFARNDRSGASGPNEFANRCAVSREL